MVREFLFFFQMKYIFNVDTTWVLCGKLIFPKYFSQHFYAYSVKFDQEWTVIQPGAELDFNALDIYTVDGDIFVAMKYCV